MVLVDYEIVISLSLYYYNKKITLNIINSQTILLILILDLYNN